MFFCFFFRLESYSWVGQGVNKTELMIIEDVYGGEPLHGNMLEFFKDRSDQKMKTNYLGAECLTQPNLCKNGFSVKFVLKGNVSAFCFHVFMLLEK